MPECSKSRGINENSVVFVDKSFMNRNNLHNLWLTNLAPRQFNFIFNFVDSISYDLINSFPIHFTSDIVYHISQYSYFLIESKNRVSLKTFEWWTEKACNQPQLVAINFYNKTSAKWSKNMKIPPKFMNFHNCTLTTQSSIFQTYIHTFAKENNALDIHSGISISTKMCEIVDDKFFKIIAHYGNFTPFRPSPFTPTSSIAYNLYYGKQTPRYVTAHCSSLFDSVKFIILYSPTEPYSNYEKMVMPFDKLTWMFLGVTFGMAFIMIFFMNLLPRKLKDIVYGTNVKMPSFNVIGTFFGIGQTKLPDNNFARIILMSFIIFCLIFRTCYQGRRMQLKQ